MAERVAERMAEEQGLTGVEFTSAATSSEELGAPIDRRAEAVLREHGYRIDGHQAHRITREEIETADLVIAMEDIHVTRMMLAWRPRPRNVSLLTDYDPDAEPGSGVPDPWYGTAGGFYDTLAAVEAAMPGVLDRVRELQQREPAGADQVVALVEIIEQVVHQTGFSGVVRVDRDGETLVRAAYGFADRRHGIAMTPETQLATASGSKVLTALTVMRLVEQGRLTLATSARSLLGDDLPLIADDVTVEHLLGHRSGIGDYLDEETDLSLSDYLMPVSVHRLATTTDFLPLLAGYPAKFPAGQRFSYCNSGYMILALIIERSDGTGYHDAVQAQVRRSRRTGRHRLPAFR